jgi:UDP-3-O-[3-hydroxymyristoyl] N-acetylglucosamine deacetylase
VLESWIHFAHPLVGLQSCCFCPETQDFAQELAPARTFGFWDEVQALLARGLARGGDLANALVIGGPGGFSSPPRFADEPVRHKTLDLCGDLALLGAPLRARVLTLRGGHRLHLELARKILEETTHAGLA